ncbi:hemin ABC transporter substrate-binding protein [Nitratireductor sp. B36]|uniref:heme/hemin ABC transporter substrate-binding protein n=1 Tax=Nitratireductor sp. B36 TaxID=2762059 RepID=UPI001E571E52|nr:ABC transporter substrate-binding protein [Nitratireductor sp. B36]
MTREAFGSMTRRGMARLFMGLVASVGVGCGSVAAQEAIQPFPDASRLVSIGGAITEIIYGLGEGDRLVARDTTSTYPPQAEQLPDIGYMRALSPEGVLSVGPSAILAMEGSGPIETMDTLKASRIPVVTVPEGYDREAVLRKIRVVGAALNAEAKAEKLALQVEADLDAAQKEARKQTDGKRVLFVLSMQGGRVMVAGKNTAADGIINMAGAENAMDGFSGYRQVSAEAVISAAPDAVLMMARGGADHLTSEDVLSHPAIASTPAGEGGALIRMDGSYLLGFGPRTAQAVRDLAHALQETETVTD